MWPSAAGRRSARSEIVLTVADQGCGIPATNSTRSFNRSGLFEKGTGLGLAIVHRIVTDYNGSVQYRPPSGAGTTVRVKLPSMQ